MNNYFIECLKGLFWAILILTIIFVHYYLCVDRPVFRYIEF